MVLRVFRHFVRSSIIYLAFGDLLLVFIAFHLISRETSLLSTQLFDTLGSPSLKLSAIIAVGALASGLYDRKSFSNYRAMATQILWSLIFTITAISSTFFFLANWSGPFDWFWEVQKAALVWLICILLTRAVFVTVADLDAFKRRILVLGSGDKAARIAAISEGRGARFLPVAFVHERSAAEPPEISASDDNALLRQALALQVNEIVVASDDRRGAPVRVLLMCRREGVKVTSYLDFIERETNSIDVEALQPGWLVFADGFRFSWGARFWKRSADIALSVALLLLTLPLLLFTSVLVMIDSSGPVLLRQERVGLGGRTFVLLKFRSMFADAEKDGVARWATLGDCRVTRVGRFIRKFRIDELPQLLNVLRGDMSVVGPRPERPVFVEELTKQLPFYKERHWVKPGITGWAQIKYRYGASLEDARVKLSYDLYYIKNHGLFLDLLIALQTVRVILRGEGAL